MNIRILLAALVAALAVLVSGPTSPATAAPQVHASSVVHLDKKVCTKTSSGSCIRGGQFCPQASYGRTGYDAVGRRYVCKGDRTHPHWMR